MRAFRRRTYHRLREMWRDVRFIVRNRSLVKRTMRGELVPPSFRERLMMVVTTVNGCRYCSYVHTRMALRTGVSQEEMRDLLAGTAPRDAPSSEMVALAYAQHWAESNAAPDPQAVQRLVDTYGQEKVDAIHMVLRMIRTANLAGNGWDALLYRVSLGRWG